MRFLLSIVLSVIFCSTSLGQWEYEAKKAFKDTCVKRSSALLNLNGAESYCDCALEKMMEKYPHPEYARETDSLFLKEVSLACTEQVARHADSLYASSSWTASAKKEFLTGCRNSLVNSGVDPDPYCHCVLEKLMAEFPDPMRIHSLSAQDINRMAAGCLPND